MAKKEGEKISKLSGERNRVVHDAWYVDAVSDSQHQHRRRPRKNPEAFGIEEKRNEELTSLIERIVRRIEAIASLSEAIDKARAR